MNQAGLLPLFGLETWWTVLAAGVVLTVVGYVIVAAIKRHLP